MTAPVRAWMLNGRRCALVVRLDARAHAIAGELRRKRDLAVLARWRQPASGPLRWTSVAPTPLPRALQDERDTLVSALKRGPGASVTAATSAAGQRHQVQLLLRALGIDASTLAGYRPPPCREPARLQLAGLDRVGRALWLRADAAGAWLRLRAAAGADGIALEPVSGFRSAEYQAGLLARKLARGVPLAAILKVSALPGHSEHHLGTTLDLHAGEGPVLESGFEATNAFAWLQRHAGPFGFSLSYPRDNPWGIAYEPWHWRYRRPGLP